MPARYSRISWRTSSTLSRTTYFVPSTRKATVSGWASTRSMRSGLSAKPSPFRRVTRITVGPLVDGAGPRGRARNGTLRIGLTTLCLEPNGVLTPSGGGVVADAGRPGRRAGDRAVGSRAAGGVPRLRHRRLRGGGAGQGGGGGSFFFFWAAARALREGGL